MDFILYTSRATFEPLTVTYWYMCGIPFVQRTSVVVSEGGIEFHWPYTRRGELFDRPMTPRPGTVHLMIRERMSIKNPVAPKCTERPLGGVCPQIFLIVS